MKMSLQRKVVSSLAGLLALAGCAAQRAHYELSPVEQFFGNRADVTRQLDEVLARRRPAADSSVAVAWLEWPRATGRMATQMQDDFVAKIRRTYPGRVLPISPVQLSVNRSATDPLIAYRIAAADLQSDVLVAVATRSDEYVDTNFLGVLYIGLVTIPFVPASDVSVETSAEACAIDVRSGTVFQCVRGTDVAKRSFTPMFQTEQYGRQLSEQALQHALNNLPDAMSIAIRDAALRLRAGTPSRRGQTYQTATD